MIAQIFNHLFFRARFVRWNSVKYIHISFENCVFENNGAGKRVLIKAGVYQPLIFLIFSLKHPNFEIACGEFCFR